MARGRKANPENVVPMRDDAAAGANLEDRAEAKLAEIEEGLKGFHWPRGLRPLFRRLALPLCHPTRNRLNDGNAFMFLQFAKSVQRHEEAAKVIAEHGETYKSKGRDGEQIKMRPEVGQLNETWRQIRSLAGEFGMTPQTERGLAGAAQLGFNFEDDEFAT